MTKLLYKKKLSNQLIIHDNKVKRILTEHHGVWDTRISAASWSLSRQHRACRADGIPRNVLLVHLRGP